jgi:hypothetical protein
MSAIPLTAVLVRATWAGAKAAVEPTRAARIATDFILMELFGMLIKEARGVVDDDVIHNIHRVYSTSW